MIVLSHNVVPIPGPSTSLTSLSGLAFPGGDLPRDARTITRFRSSPWDPTVGGFSGVQISTTLAPGGNIASRRMPAMFNHACPSRQ